MFGIMEAMLGFLRRQVGLRTDSASASGSLHAKFANGLNRIGSANPASGGTDTMFKYLKKLSSEQGNFNISTPGFIVATTESRSLSTLLNITGSGFLIGCLCCAEGGNKTSYHYLEITIDGDVIVPEYRFVRSQRVVDDYIHMNALLPFLFRFHNSLVIKHRARDEIGNEPVTTAATYILD